MLVEVLIDGRHKTFGPCDGDSDRCIQDPWFDGMLGPDGLILGIQWPMELQSLTIRQTRVGRNRWKQYTTCLRGAMFVSDPHRCFCPQFSDTATFDG